MDGFLLTHAYKRAEIPGQDQVEAEGPCPAVKPGRGPPGVIRLRQLPSADGM
jgi:hypothetical protein